MFNITVLGIKVKDVLVKAVHDGKTTQVIALLKGRADPDTRDSDGTPVLCVAAFKVSNVLHDILYGKSSGFENV